MKTIEERLVELDRFLKEEREAFEISAKKATARKMEKYSFYCEGVASAYAIIRSWLHTQILCSKCEPGDVLTTILIQNIRRELPERLKSDIMDR